MYSSLQVHYDQLVTGVEYENIVSFYILCGYFTSLRDILGRIIVF